MSKRFFLVLFLSLCTLGSSSYAKPICNTINECQTVIDSAAVRLQELSNGGSSRRTSRTGAVFMRDASNSALGEAYKDQLGLIWGSPVMAQGEVSRMSQYDADKYCKDIGARLPTKEDFEQLANFLGEGTANGYGPYLADNKTDLLPGLSGNNFWSSSIEANKYETAHVFISKDGLVAWDFREKSTAVRCVVGR